MKTAKIQAPSAAIKSSASTGPIIEVCVDGWMAEKRSAVSLSFESNQMKKKKEKIGRFELVWGFRGARIPLLNRCVYKITITIGIVWRELFSLECVCVGRLMYRPQRAIVG